MPAKKIIFNFQFAYGLLLPAFCLAAGISVQAQSPASKAYDASIFYGYHFASNNVYKTNQSLNGFVSGVDLSIIRHGSGKKEFDETYGNPAFSLKARLVKMNHTDTFGYSIGILPSIALPLFSGKSVQLLALVSYGINFNTRQYHFTQNFDNRAISSAVNFALDWSIQAKVPLSKNMQLKLGSGLYHVSNGSLKMPNGGINILYAQAGFGFLMNNQAFLPAQKPRYKLVKPQWHYQASASFGYRELGYFQYTKQFWTFSLKQNAYYSFNKLFSLGMGLDGFYDATQALLYQNKLQVSDIPENQKYFTAAGLYSQFDIGRLFLPLGIYHYIYPLKVVKEPVYVRFGPGFNLNEKWFMGLFFKGTINGKGMLQSDFMEWTAGYRL